jgi:hypothetical protein
MNAPQGSRHDLADARRAALPVQRATYHFQTLRPAANLLFVVPLIAVHLAGVLVLADASLHGGPGSWLATATGLNAVTVLCILAAATVGTLLLGDYRTASSPLMPGEKGQRVNAACQRVRLSTLAGMVAESAALGLLVLWTAQALYAWWQPAGDSLLLASSGASDGELSGAVRLVVAACGAGWCEELVFRLVLLSGLALILQRIGMGRTAAFAVASIPCSLLFAAAHYEMLNPTGEAFEPAGFSIRVLVSLCFCAIYVFRGFGVAAGAHAAYNIFAPHVAG